LLDKFVRAGRLAELYSLDKCGLKLSTEDVGSFDFEVVIAERNQISDRFTVHICPRLQERLHLPLLVIPRI